MLEQEVAEKFTGSSFGCFDCWRMMSVPEVAEYLQVTPSHVYRLIREGALVGVRVGKLVRVDQTELARFIDRNSTGIEEASSNGNA